MKCLVLLPAVKHTVESVHSVSMFNYTSLKFVCLINESTERKNRGTPLQGVQTQYKLELGSNLVLWMQCIKIPTHFDACRQDFLCHCEPTFMVIG